MGRAILPSVGARFKALIDPVRIVVRTPVQADLVLVMVIAAGQQVLRFYPHKHLVDREPGHSRRMIKPLQVRSGGGPAIKRCARCHDVSCSSERRKQKVEKRFAFFFVVQNTAGGGRIVHAIRRIRLQEVRKLSFSHAQVHMGGGTLHPHT